MRMTRLTALPFALALALAGCSGGGSGGPSAPNTPNTPNNPGTPGTPGTPSASATVAMETSDDGYGQSTSAFVPAAVTIVRNGSVSFTNSSGVAHNVVFAAVAGAPANITNHTSGSNVRTFTTAGTFNFSCTNHAGMNGTVTVTP